MNWVTLVLVAIIALLTWRAYRNGFVRELVSLSAMILAVPVAGIFYDDMVPKVEPITDNADLAALISFLAILFGVVIAGQVAAYLLRQFVSILNLGTIDNFAGGVFGAAKALLICQVLLIAFVLFPSPDIREEIDSSRLATTMLDAGAFVFTILPDSFQDGVDLFLATPEDAAEARAAAERAP